MMTSITIQAVAGTLDTSRNGIRRAIEDQDAFAAEVLARMKVRSEAAAGTTSAADNAGSAAPSSLTQSAVSQQKSSSDAFREYMAMTPTERMRYSIMAGMGITPEEYAAMTPEEQEAIDAKVAERIRQLTEEKTDDSAARHAATQLKASLASYDGQGNEDAQRRLNLLA
jgi:hypothetical protein